MMVNRIRNMSKEEKNWIMWGGDEGFLTILDEETETNISDNPF